jgi:anthraniloyl-CoA monooxygenase
MKRTVAVIGGGPAGLMAARLMARDHSDWEVTVYERLAPVDTFGFGVGLTPSLLASLSRVTPDVHEQLVAASAGFSSAGFRLPDGDVELPSYHAGAISRSRLLQVLGEAALGDGVRVDIGASPVLADVAGADLVIAADGVSSAVRDLLSNELGVTDTLGRGLFIWCGAPIALEGTVFMPVRTRDGIFTAHAYPYGEGRSTFVIETDVESLERAGCRTDSFSADGDSDEASLAYLSDAFADLLGGERFIGNRSRWMQFRTVRCARWSHDNVVILGDAAATAHPSLGSGTKLALESAIALAETLASVEDESPASRLTGFEARQRPDVERIQERAHRSQLWWESFPSRLSMTPAQIAFAYMSRAGAVSLEDLHRAAPQLAEQVLADFAGVRREEVPDVELQRWVLAQPLSMNGHSLPARLADGDLKDPELSIEIDDPWGPEAEQLLARLSGRADADASVVTLTGADSRAALLDRLALGERIRSELGFRVTVTCAGQQLDDAVDGLVAGRTDLIKVGEGDEGP